MLDKCANLKFRGSQERIWKIVADKGVGAIFDGCKVEETKLSTLDHVG
jgi:hypothetical protein